MSAGAGADDDDAGASAGAGAVRTKPRKRSRTMHNGQVVQNWLGDADHGHNDAAPTDLLAKMSNDDLYEDAYLAEPGKDVSFDNLPLDMKRAMMDSLAKMGPVMRGRTIRADHDPTAVTVPKGHRHDMVELDQDKIDVAIDSAPKDRMCGVKPAHRKQFTLLENYNVAEAIFSRYEVQKQGAGHITVGDVAEDLEPCFVHSMQVPEDSGYILVTFELDTHGVFFCSVALKLRTGYPAGNYIWSTKDSAAFKQIEGTYVGHVYFECECV